MSSNRIALSFALLGVAACLAESPQKAASVPVEAPPPHRAKASPDPKPEPAPVTIAAPSTPIALDGAPRHAAPKPDKAVARESGLLGSLGTDNAIGLRGHAIGDAGGLGGLGTRGQGAGGGGVGYGHGEGKLGKKGEQHFALNSVSGEPVTTGDFEGRAEQTINAPKDAQKEPLSTFAIDVDTAAYSIARRSLNAGRMPEPSLVRVEELINYFHYDYDPPTSGAFSIQFDGAQSPVDATKHFLRIGIQARPVTAETRLPANLVFLMDTSCSMTPPDRLALAKKSVEIAVGKLSGKDRVAITTYAGGVSLVLPPTPASDKETIQRAIRGIQPGGGTAMESGLTLAYRQAAAMLKPGTTTRIIVCSDGDANIGATTPAELLRRVEGYVKEGVTLSTIGFGDGNYKDETMEQIANKGNGNYYYVDTLRQAERVFGRDLFKMIQDVAQDVKIQVEVDPRAVKSYRLVGYENRAIANKDFRNDKVDAGEIGAGHQVTAIYELALADGAEGNLATVRVRAKEPGGSVAKETARSVAVGQVRRPFERAPSDLRFATAVLGGAELLRNSPHAEAWTYDRVLALISDAVENGDPDRTEFLALMKRARELSGSSGRRLSAR